MRLNLKSICLFEQIRGKSFSNIDLELEDDLVAISYSMYVVNGDTKNITLEEFIDVTHNDDISVSIASELADAMRYTNQNIFNLQHSHGSNSSVDVVDTQYISDIVGGIIVKGGLSPQYVMESMELWELPIYAKALECRERELMEEHRLWTYLGIAPHIDTDKIDSAKKLLPFPWELAKEEEDKKENLDESFKIISSLLSE